VYPSLTYREVGAALTWLEEAFGFEGQVIDEVSAIVMVVGEAMLEVRESLATVAAAGADRSRCSWRMALTSSAGCQRVVPGRPARPWPPSARGSRA
jgi:hypothetical protein